VVSGAVVVEAVVTVNEVVGPVSRSRIEYSESKQRRNGGHGIVVRFRSIAITTSS
jgi:hypothetical protein